MIEFFLRLDLTGGTHKIVRAFKRDEMDSFVVHGKDFSVPFADCEKSAAKWAVTHEKTGMEIFPARYMTKRFTFRQACKMQIALDDAYDGWGQIARNPAWTPGGNEPLVVGFYGEPASIAARVCIEWERSGSGPKIKSEWRKTITSLANGDGRCL